MFANEKWIIENLAEAKCPSEFWINRSILEPKFRYKEDQAEIIMIKEAMTMKESEENPLSKLLADENFTKEEVKEKLLETLIWKSITSYSLFFKLFVKYGPIIKEHFENPSDLIN